MNVTYLFYECNILVDDNMNSYEPVSGSEMNMHGSAEQLLRAVKSLVKNPKIRALVNSRLREFKENKDKSEDHVFKELCFCILTANFDASRAIKIQNAIGDGFLTLSKKQLSKMLKQLGHRFPNTRADYIVSARRYKSLIKSMIVNADGKEIREWLVNNIKGVGYKEASHFLRNIGFTNLAIIDFHILDLLYRFGLINKPKALTKQRYLKIEQLLKSMARTIELNLAELDLYLWYLETGKILK